MTDELTEGEREAIRYAAYQSPGGPGDPLYGAVERILADRLAVARAEALTEAAVVLDSIVPNPDTMREDCRLGYCAAMDDAATILRDRAAIARAAAVARDREGL